MIWGISKENIIQTVTPLLEKEARSTGVFDVWNVIKLC